MRKKSEYELVTWHDSLSSFESFDWEVRFGILDASEVANAGVRTSKPSPALLSPHSRSHARRPPTVGPMR